MYEPFVGGLNFSTEFLKNYTMNYHMSDCNKYLVAMWDALIKGWEAPEYVTKEEYIKVRDNKDDDLALTGWIGFNCSYSGKFFGGFAGKCQTKDGERNYQNEKRRNILNQLTHINEQCTIECKEYYNLDIKPNSLIYCDPPYANTTGYANTFEHKKFWDWCFEQAKHSIVYVSEYSCPVDPRIQCVYEKQVKSSLRSNNLVKNSSAKSSTEKLYKIVL